jgi:hypothetical protein
MPALRIAQNKDWVHHPSLASMRPRRDYEKSTFPVHRTAKQPRDICFQENREASSWTSL